MTSLPVPTVPTQQVLQAGYGKIDAVAGLKKILGISTGIETIGTDARREANSDTTHSVDAPVYNMKGQRVDHPVKGVYIMNGKKVIFK